MTQIEEKKGFSWMGLLFGGAYYAGYGQLVKGIIMAVISFIPLTAIPVNIYAGLKARKQLPVGSQSFNWGAAVGVFIIPVVLGGAILFFTQGGSDTYAEADFRSDASGYWVVGSTGDELGFDLRSEPYALIAGGGRSTMELLSFSPVDSDGYSSANFRLSNGKVVILTMDPSDPKVMALSSPGATDDILTFVRAI